VEMVEIGGFRNPKKKNCSKIRLKVPSKIKIKVDPGLKFI